MYITQAFMACIGIIGIFRYKLLIKPLKILLWYIIFSLLVDGIKDIMIFHRIRTLWIDHWFSILELLLFLLIFNYWRINKKYTNLSWFLFVVYIIVWILGKFSFEPFEYSDVYSQSISQSIQIGFGIPLLIAIIRDENTIWKNDPRFWCISGIVFYAAAVFFLFSLSNVMLTLSRPIMRIIWNLNNLFIVIQYIFFLKAFLCNPASAGIIHQSQTTHKE